MSTNASLFSTMHRSNSLRFNLRSAYRRRLRQGRSLSAAAFVIGGAVVAGLVPSAAWADGVESGPGAPPANPANPAPRITFTTTTVAPSQAAPTSQTAATSQTVTTSQTGATTIAPASTAATPSVSVVGGSTTTVLSENKDYIAGKAALDAKNWKQAMSWLSAATRANPGDANAWNLLGYATRKNGDPKRALRLYDRALRLNPKHLGALEYQGEAYVELKQITKAKANLARLKTACGTSCEQYLDLAEMIAKAR
jgi:hypothetical protein